MFRNVIARQHVATPLLITFALTIFVATAVRDPAAENRAGELKQQAIRQLWPTFSHRFEATTRVDPAAAAAGPAQQEVRSEHSVHPDGWYRVRTTALDTDASGTRRPSLEKQASWNGEQSFLVQKSVSGKESRPIMAGSDEAGDGLNAIGGVSNAALFNGFSRYLGSALPLLLSDVPVSDISYSRDGDAETLRVPLAGGHTELRFSDGRLVGWTSQWREGDALNGVKLPREVGEGTANGTTLDAVIETVTLSDFRATPLGVELPHTALVEVQHSFGGKPVQGGRLNVERSNIEKLADANKALFSPAGIPVGNRIEAFDTNDTRQYVWTGDKMVLDDGTALEDQMKAKH